MDYLKNSNTAVYWYPVFAVMLGTGLRVGEVTGLRWCDIDLEDGIIDVNHTLVYYCLLYTSDAADERSGV